MIQVDERLYRNPRYLHVGEVHSLMIVPEEARKNAVFLSVRYADGTIKIAGTGFLVARKVDDEIWFQYLVTARHTIDGAKESGFDRILQNPTFLAIAGTVAVGQVLIVTFGGRVFNVEPLGPLAWLLVIAFTSTVLLFAGCIGRADLPNGGDSGVDGGDLDGRDPDWG